MSKKLTLDYLDTLIVNLFWNETYKELDTKGALIFLYEMGFLDIKKIDTNSFEKHSALNKNGGE